MRHSDPRLAANIYSHTRKERLQHVAEAVGAVVKALAKYRPAQFWCIVKFESLIAYIDRGLKLCPDAAILNPWAVRGSTLSNVEHRSYLENFPSHKRSGV